MKRRRITPFRVLLTALLALIVIAVFTARLPDADLKPRPGEEVRTIWIVDNGFHTDIAMPSERILAGGGPAAEALRRLPPRRWVLVGWGDARFYTESGFTTARVVDGLRALFAPGNPSVVHLVGFDAEPRRAFGGTVIPLRISARGEAALLARLDAAFARPVRLTGRWGPDDGFFAGSETFSILHLCNHWTGELLAAAGFANAPVVNSVPGGLLAVLRAQGARPLDEGPPRP